tara:strand:- start:55 stop:792 length:738 start_codon:yes stop_codon:yes gene_type:complete
MPGPVLFIPDRAHVDGAALLALGAEEFLDPLIQIGCVGVPAGGPGGLRGTLVIFKNNYISEMDSKVVNEYEWRAALPDGNLEAGRFWIGRPKADDQQFSPGDFERLHMLQGLPVILKDGNAWQIPMAQYLPQQQGLNSEGKECRRALDEHLGFSEKAKEYYELLMGVELSEEEAVATVIEINGSFEFATMALAKNYRINRDYVDWLALLGDAEMFEVISATVGLNLKKQIAAQKKTAGSAEIVTM